MLSIVLTLRILPGCEASTEALLRRMESETLAVDEGCLRYEWHRSDEACTYVLLQRWADEPALLAHFKSARMSALMAECAPLAAERFQATRLTRLG